MLPLLISLAAAAGGVRGYRWWHGRRVERAYQSRFPVSTDGIAAGAEPFTLRADGGRALLLLHGSGDTPQTLRFLAERLHAEGFTVHAPLLPGHGRSPRAFTTVSADAYMATARAALETVRREGQWLGIVGLSMGGALAARLAAESPDAEALVLLAPYLSPPVTVEVAARTGWLWGQALTYMPGRGDASVHDPMARNESRAYGVFPPAALAALVETAAAGRRALASVTAPTLVVNSREDIRIPTALAESGLETLRAPTERHWVAGCGHVITVDYCRDAVARLVVEFLVRHAR